MSTVDCGDILLLLADFNARVGSSCDLRFGDVACFDDIRGDGDGWSCVRGRYGFGFCNEAGENLLSFCAIHDLSKNNKIQIFGPGP